MSKRRHAVFTAVAMALALSACNGEPHIGDSYFLGWGSTPVIDAKQRAIINTKAEKRDDGIPGHNEPTRMVCAEPSPDVTQAISETMKLAVQADLSRKNQVGNTESLKVSTDFARALTASVAQLGERLASIQLLRDKMYRACEAYANGAINSTTYTTIMARFDKSMVTLLSSELAAGAFGRELAALGGSANLSGPPREVIEGAEKNLRTSLGEYNKSFVELNKKQKATADAQSAFDAATAKLTASEDKLSKSDQANADAYTIVKKERDDDKISKDQKETELKSRKQDLNDQQEKTDANFKDVEKNIDALAKISSAGATMNVAQDVKTRSALTSQTNGSAEAVVKIHQAYMDDDGLEALIDSCIASMDYTTPVVAKTYYTLKKNENSDTQKQLVKALKNNRNRIKEIHSKMPGQNTYEWEIAQFNLNKLNVEREKLLDSLSHLNEIDTNRLASMLPLSKECASIISKHSGSRHSQETALRAYSINEITAQKDLISTRQSCIEKMLKDASVGKDLKAVYSICGVASGAPQAGAPGGTTGQEAAKPTKPAPAQKQGNLVLKKLNGDKNIMAPALAEPPAPKPGPEKAPVEGR
jgi:hypothetical protein